MKISTQVRRIKSQQSKLQIKLLHIQNNECSHPAVNRIPKGNTGNYDQTQDSYWYECKCLDCEKWWTEPQ